MKESAREIFAKNLNLCLRESGKTQADIVRDLGYKQPTVSDWVKGKKYPRVDKMEELAQYLNVSMSALTDEQVSGLQAPTETSDDDIKFALFEGDAGEITDEMYEDVKRYAQFVKEKRKNDAK